MKMTPNQFFLSIVLAILSTVHVNGFAVSSSPASNEAIAVFQKKYPPKPSSSEGSTPLNTAFSNESEQRSAFSELEKLYGSEQALEMTKAMPVILAFDYTKFEAVNDAYAGVFGVDETKGLVGRNPGLLGVRPAAAAKADGLTVFFSYVVSVTRPLGPLLGIFWALLLSVPIIEGTTGISVKGIIFGN